MNPGVAEDMMKIPESDFFNSIDFFYNLIKPFFFGNLEPTEENLVNYLNTHIFNKEELTNLELKFLKNNFSLILFKKWEELVDYSKPYNLILLPFEGLKALNTFFVKFLVYSTLTKDFVAAFGFNPYNDDFFYVDLFNCYYNKFNSRKNDLTIVERKKFEDMEKEIKSRAFFIDFIQYFYQKNDFLFLYSPNYSFLLTIFGVFKEFYNLGFDNSLEELFFANFFIEKSKFLKENLIKQDLKVDLENFYLIRSKLF
jgi:hypothetical protein